jgi:ubiquinone/menaquinone biosynthesis C-methylase UbiE
MLTEGVEMGNAADQWSTAFADASTAGTRVYDELLATLFEPWAEDLVDRLALPEGATVLDVACGPGTVTHRLAARVGRAGKVVGTDVSPAMLQIARSKPLDPDSAPIRWVEAPASPLPVESAAFDAVACQQGLQFFPDKIAALAEMRRALKPGGRAVVTCWTRVEDQLFGALHAALGATISDELAARYPGPFSLGGEVAADHGRNAGFADVRLETVTLRVVVRGGADALVATLAASGIAADIAALDEPTLQALVADVDRRVLDRVRDGRLHATLTASVLTLA